MRIILTKPKTFNDLKEEYVIVKVKEGQICCGFFDKNGYSLKNCAIIDKKYVFRNLYNFYLPLYKIDEYCSMYYIVNEKTYNLFRKINSFKEYQKIECQFEYHDY